MVDGLTYIPFQPGPGLVENIASHIEHQIVAGILRSGDRIQEITHCRSTCRVPWICPGIV